jgi:hypothetical protein
MHEDWFRGFWRSGKSVAFANDAEWWLSCNFLAVDGAYPSDPVSRHSIYTAVKRGTVFTGAVTLPFA